MNISKWLMFAALAGVCHATLKAQANAATDPAELVKKSLNPVADLIRVPL